MDPGNTSDYVPHGIRRPGTGRDPDPLERGLASVKAKVAALLSHAEGWADVLDIGDEDLELLAVLRATQFGEVTVTIRKGRPAVITVVREQIDLSKEHLLPKRPL